MNLLKWLHNLFANDIIIETEVYDEPVPYLTFPCGECEYVIIIDNPIFPGDVCVIKCGNCSESWSVYCKSLEISKTSEFEEVWPHIAKDVKHTV